MALTNGESDKYMQIMCIPWVYFFHVPSTPEQCIEQATGYTLIFLQIAQK